MNRKTSSYQIEIPGDDAVLRGMIALCPVAHEAVNVRGGECLLRFRAAGDREARRVAYAVAAGRKYKLHTGFGIHRRFL